MYRFSVFVPVIPLVLLSVTLTAMHADEPIFPIEVGRCAAAPGDYVLCPSRVFYESAVKKGPEKATFVYYAAEMIAPGNDSSRVRNLAGREFSLPNQLIIPIPIGQRALIGDTVLTWWQSGSGMQRAIVVGGTESAPVIRYLDIAYDNPSGIAQQQFRLKEDSFLVLKTPWQVGTTVAVRHQRREMMGQLLAKDDRQILVRLFGGRLQVFDREQATPLPIRPTLGAGDPAQAALYGSLKPVTVTRVDHGIGRIFATYQLGRAEKQKVFSFGEIRSESPPDTEADRPPQAVQETRSSAKIKAKRESLRAQFKQAVQENRVDVVAALLKEGITVDMPCRFISAASPATALAHAAASGNRELVELLIGHGAHPMSRDSNGLSPIDHALKHRQPAIARFIELSRSQPDPDKH